MTLKEPSLDQWRQLYDAAARILALAPWDWMLESDLFGIELPGSEERGYMSVMGNLGDHFAVSVYLGGEGLHGYWGMYETEEMEDSAMRLLEIPQVQVSFEDRGVLEPKDRGTIKALGLSFRGVKAWPQFRSFRPGHLPWFIEPHEAEIPLTAMEQLENVALRCEADPRLLEPSGDEEDYLVRVRRQGPNGPEWVDVREPSPAPPRVEIVASVSAETIEALRRIKPTSRIVEMDFFLTMAKIGPKGARPSFPHTLMLADSDSGMILGIDLLEPVPSHEAMWGTLPQKAAEMLVKLKLRPREIAAGSEKLAAFLRAFAPSLDIRLSVPEELPTLDTAKAGLLQFMERGMGRRRK